MTNEYKYIMKYTQLWFTIFSTITLVQQTLQYDCTAGNYLTGICDPRCNNRCTVDYDQNFCCRCVTTYNTGSGAVNHYLWVQDQTANNGVRCGPTCPTLYYPDTTTSPYRCSPCTYPCQTCTTSGNTNCVTCVPAAYQQGVTTCWHLNTTDNQNAGRPYSLNPCAPPYYGHFPTKKCQPCPTGCTLCNLNLTRQMPSTFSAATYSWTTNCTGDGLCGYTLKCFECTTPTYVLQQNICITRNRCRKYSLYNSTTSGFSSAYCYCKTGFYLTGVTSCSPCHYLCKSCSGPAANQCIICHDGAMKVGTACVKNSTYEYITIWGGARPANTATEIWTPTMTGAGGAAWTAAQTDCPSTQYVFGYYGYTSASVSKFGTASLTFYTDNAVIQAPHYGVHFRAKFLFIDDWVDGLMVVFQENGVQKYTYRYAMENIIGEYFCGRASHDHHDYIDFTFSHARIDNVSLSIRVPHAGYAWGIRQVVIGVLKCDISCSSCDGPTQYDCLSCDINQTLVNGDCVCDVDLGFYNDTNNGGICSDNCTLDWYMNPITRTCTQDCTNATFHFQYTNTSNNTRYCLQNCPQGYWKMQTNMTCVDDCYDDTLADDVNYYNFDGLDKVCYQDCPDGYYGDPVSHYCVTTCPLTPNASDNGNISYYVLGKICVLYCSNITYAYSPNRTCLSSCPTGYYKNTIYVDGNIYNVCQDICSVTLNGESQLGDNSTGTCVDYCPEGSYGDYVLHICVAHCNVSSFRQVVNVSGTIIRTCETYCDSAGFDLYGNEIKGECLPAKNCSLNTFGDPNTTFCEYNCTDPDLYGDNTTQLCQATCTNDGFKQNYTKKCVRTCPIQNYDGDPQFGDHIYQNDYCVLGCVENTYADVQQNRECVFVCKASPVSSFGQNNKCVYKCAVDTWGDPNQNRTCTTSCTWEDAGIQTYGQNQTRLCISSCPDTTFSIILSGIVYVNGTNGTNGTNATNDTNYTTTTPVCVYICQERTVGMFGYPENNTCVETCPQPYYGDPTGNRTCVLECPDFYFAQNTTAAGVISDVRICVLECQYGWADNITRKCATTSEGCSAGLYAHETNHTCVQPLDCIGFADPITRHCIPTCYADGNVSYYGDNSTKKCVLICPYIPDTFGDNNTHECEYECTMNTTQVRDPQYLRRCVTACSRTPLALYFDVLAGNCVTTKNCTEGTYADNSTERCQADCQDPLHQYADPVSKQCVMQCELGWYGYNRSASNGICVQRCPLDLWADNITVLCTPRCSNGTYGVNITNATSDPYNYGICQTECPEDQFARDTDNVCVPNCGPDLWGNNETNKCVTSPYDCPEGQYADNETHMCVIPWDCSEVSGVQWVADNRSRECLPSCPLLSIVENWADMDKRLCVAKCPHQYFGFNTTRVCLLECRESNSSAWVDQFADPQLRMCVFVCSSWPIPTFGQTLNYTCVQARQCPDQTWAQIITSQRRCIDFCPNASVVPGLRQNYADNISKTCVTTCPTYFYGDLQRGYGMCVDVCPSTNDPVPQLQFSDNLTKTCVTVCPVSQNTFGDVISLRCVLTCPDDYYAQEEPVRHCVQVCANDTWGNDIRRFCQTTPFNCPTINDTHYYADNYSHMCVLRCPASQDTWGQNSTWVCEENCTTGFKYNISRVCIDICPPSLDGDGSFSDQNMCYFTCMTPGYFRDPQFNRSCQPECSFTPVKYWGDETTWKCVLDCPTYPEYYYAYDPTKMCRTDCPNQTIRDPLTRKCVDYCPNNTFYDNNTDQCVEQCPPDNNFTEFFGDPTLAFPECVIAQDCSNNTWADSHVGLCVADCTESQWKTGKVCVTHCPAGYYGNHHTGFCVLPLDCPANHYAQNYTRTCVSKCNGTFADTNLKVCVDVCPTSYFADAVTRLCSQNCTNNASITLHRNYLNKTCVSNCSEYLYLNPLNNTCEPQCDYPYYQDRTTQMCVTMCPSVPPLFADNHTFACVEECQNDTQEFKYIPERTCVVACPSGYFRDNTTLFCVQECENVTYADSTKGYCVFNCSPLYSLDQPIHICTSLCPSPYYRDPTSFKCVTDCPTSPVQYFKAKSGSDYYCDTNCPTDQFRDLFSFSCVTLCPPSPPTYADTSSGNCVSVCPSVPDLYANLQTRKCVSKCPDGMYAENVTRTCVYKCPNKTDLYADQTLTIPKCVHLCSSGYFADPYTLTCVDACTRNPQTYGFDNTTNRICVASCPYPYIADNSTYRCLLYCNSTAYPYLDLASKSCVSECSSYVYRFSYMPTNQVINGTCVKYCPNGRFALLTTNQCVPRCPAGLYGDTTNNTCYENCTLANGRFADSTTNLCVDVCPYSSSYDSYGDLFSRTCVLNCPLDKFTVKDTNTRLCQPSCTRNDEYIDYTSGNGKCVRQCPQIPLRFGDNVSQICVTQCSQYSKLYGYIPTRVCVQQCPVAGLYANEANRLCVIARECANGTYGLDPERICVEVCPAERDLYADTNARMCTDTCPQYFYADPSTRMCVSTCPTVPSLYGKLPNKVCLAFCPDGQYADNQTRKCSSTCTTTPVQQYADNSTNICVQRCPSSPNYFSQNKTFTCVFTCPSSPAAYAMFADYSTRRCVKFCPRGDFQTFADNSTRECVFVCPNGTYQQNSTGTCVSTCTEGFADPITKFCIATCPAYSYGHLSQRKCLSICPTATPQLYAEDNTHMCQTSCLEIYKTFKDPTTKRCVKICPISRGLFAQPVNRICMSGCLRSPMQFADNSSRSCVTTCPLYPALFGQTTNLVCLYNCPNGTYADNKTRRCVTRCPDSPDTYGDNSTWSCVLYCPSEPYTWADDYSRTCVSDCPSTPDYYADNNTGRCSQNCTQGTFADPTTHTCVETCPLGYWGRNATYRCVTQCQANQFADHLLRLCVKKCSVDPIFYGNPDTHNCTEVCPNTTYSFGNPLTQQCVKYLPNGRSGCPNYHYSDNLTRLCVKVCPLIEDTYGDNSTWKCVSRCPAGSENTFSDNSTMMCVSVCPSYPEYYAEQYSRRCVPLCLAATQNYSGSFADNSTRKCVERCPDNPDYYSDNSTRRCVFECPFEPLTFADNSTRRCVKTCPSLPEDLFGNPKTRRCVLVCPEEQATYADYWTRLCVKVCPSSPSLFGNNVTNRCVPYTGCPNNSYADNTSRLCVAKCPRYPDTYGDYSTKRCVSICPPTPSLFADPFSQECVGRCPDGTYAENDTRRCMPICPLEKTNYADNVTNKCVSKCPALNHTYGDNSTRKCVYQCPDNPFTYADNMTRMCLRICNNVTTATVKGGYAQNYTRVCVEICPDGTYGDITTRYCVRYCPDNYYALNGSNMCVSQCPSPYFGDNSTWRCVIQCPVSQLFFGQSINRTCTALCPFGTYADSYSQECVPVCPGLLHDTYAYEVDRTCVQECPIPLYAYPVTWVCRSDCLDPYYPNITDHRCYKCPDQCAVCTYPQNCITCVPNHYLYAGKCLQSCPTFPTITYANPNGVCGTAFQCTSGYFALNITKSCVRDCPSGFYKNSTLQACDACLAGCSYCLNSIECITCNTTIALWDNTKCYIYCSPLRRYYTSVGCVDRCPAGYYLDLVTCLACSSVCKSCIVQPENCLTCADGYYLSNNLCVEQCPDNTKAVSQNNKLYCKSCSETDCTVTPLTYQVTQYVQDFQYKFRMKFSEKVNITQQIDKVIRIRQRTVSRRLMQVTYTYMDYTIIDYGNGEYVIVLNNFDTRENSDMQFLVQIINPEAIISESGQFPDKTRTTVIIQSSAYYSVADFNQHIANYCTIVCIVALVLLFLTFYTNQSIWMPVVDYFHLLFALLFVSMTMPPNPIYALSKAKILILSWLPNMFAGAFSKAQYDKSMTSTLYTFFGDMVFLRTMGFLYTVLLVIMVVVAVMALLWKKGKWKTIKAFCKGYLKQTLFKRDLHGYIYLFFLPTLLIGLIKMRNYTTTSPIEGFSIFSSYVFMIPMIIVPIYFMVKIFRLMRNNPTTCSMLKKGYEYITSRDAVLEENSIYFFTNQQNEVDLKEIQKPRINELLILPYPIETRFGALQLSMPLIQYIYKFLVVIFLVVAFDKGAAQLFLLLLVNIINFVYFIVVKPYYHIHHRQYNNSLVLHNLACFSLIIVCMIILQLMNTAISYDNRLLIGNVVAALVMYSMTANVLYFGFRTYHWYHEHVWRPFVFSELFRENYTLQYWDYKKEYEQVDKENKTKSGVRDEFLKAIKLESKFDGLESMVKRDPNTSSLSKAPEDKKKQKNITLRPNRNEELKKQITNMFQTFNDEKQKSHKSIKSSQRLSKQERNRVRDTIFGQKDHKAKQQNYQQMKIQEKEEEHHEDVDEKEGVEDGRINNVSSGGSDGSSTEYEYEYYEEEYPEGTDLQEILKNCKKGDIVMP